MFILLDQFALFSLVNYHSLLSNYSLLKLLKLRKLYSLSRNHSGMRGSREGKDKKSFDNGFQEHIRFQRAGKKINKSVIYQG